MSNFDPDAASRRFAETVRSDPTGWFEQLYVAARSGSATIPWDRGGANPLLVAWTDAHGVEGSGRSAVVVGAGLGDDAEHMASLGFETTAFDVAPTAVAVARERHPQSAVEYTVADLFAVPAAWRGAFDLVFESLTVQSMPVAYHERAIAAVASLVAPGGALLVLAARRDEGEDVDGPPWPLTRREIDGFASSGLEIVRVEELTDPSDPSVRRWRVELRRPA